MKTQLNIKLQALASFGEIDIFENMSLILNHTIPETNAIFVKKTHGRAGFVNFNSNTCGNVTREIADTLSIVYNKHINEIRISFLQAKYNRNKNIKPFLKTPNSDYCQWDLLKNRYPIQSKGSIQFPTDILRFTNYKSITSYGIFYWNSTMIDMLYTIPDILQPSVYPCINQKQKVTLTFPGHQHCPRQGCFTPNPLHNELFSTCNIDLYEQFLLNGFIGAPIERSAPKIRNFISTLLQNANNQKSSKIFEEIKKALGAEDSVQNDKNGELGMNIFAITTEGFKDY